MVYNLSMLCQFSFYRYIWIEITNVANDHKKNIYIATSMEIFIFFAVNHARNFHLKDNNRDKIDTILKN